jgi:di/tricarboxylate transporter
VIAPTTDIAKGALAGTYGGVTGGAAVGVGAGANVLVGGMQRSIALQPVSLEGTTGLNVAAGIGSMELKTATE